MLTLAFNTPRDLPLAVSATRSALATHGVVGLPTETFYGLAVDPHDAVAVARLHELKGRPHDKALPLAVSSLEQADALAVLDEPWRSRLKAVWPAPVTVVVPARRELAAFGATVALRIPAQGMLCSLLARVGPLTVTSANPSGGPPTTLPDDVARGLGHGLALLLDGGATPGGAPSTLLDLTVSPPLVLRPGAWQVPREWFAGR